MTLKTYLVNKLNGKKFRLNGLLPSNVLPRKVNLRQKFRDHMIYRAHQLPPKVDLRSDMTPVEDQSTIGSCGANALVGAFEYLTKKRIGRNIDFSRLFIYFNARVKDQKTQQVRDTGCTMTSAIEALEEMGTCLESIWPYDIARVNARPNDSSYQAAKSHRITEALRLNVNLEEMKSCLAQGFPFVFGLKLFSTFDQARQTGIVPSPNQLDVARQSHASHGLLAVGYSDHSKAFIVRNSWGENWGERGYCYISYDYLTNANLCFDVWTVRQVATDDLGRNHWDIFDAIDFVRNRVVPLLRENGQIISKYDAEDDSDSDDGEDKNIHGKHSWNDFCNRADDYSNMFFNASTNQGYQHQNGYFQNQGFDFFSNYPPLPDYQQQQDNQIYYNPPTPGFANPMENQNNPSDPYSAGFYGSSYGYSVDHYQQFNRFFY